MAPSVYAYDGDHNDQCSICRRGWGGGFNRHWLRTTPLLMTVKFGLEVGFDPLKKVKNPNSSLRRY